MAGVVVGLYVPRHMKDDPEFAKNNLTAASSPIKVTIIYDDFASGVRAKDFAERLAHQQSSDCQVSESFWRSDLLACPPVASEAGHNALNSDYIVVSLCGDGALPLATHRWIEAQVGCAAERRARLIVLVNSGGGNPDGRMWRAEEGARHDLRASGIVKIVPFICEVADSPTPAWCMPEFSNDRRHDSSS